MSRAKILVVEDHPLFATGIKELVEFVAANTDIICAGSIEQAREHFANSTPNLIITDLRLPDGAGQAVVDTLTTKWPGTAIVVLSGDTQLLASIEIGQHAPSWQISKSEGFEQTSAILLEALTRVGISVQWRPSSNTNRQNGQAAGEQSSGTGSSIQLTQKQQQVMHYLASGMSNKEIARKLDLSPETIKTHLREIFTRMNVRNRTQAVSLYRKIPRLNGSHQPKDESARLTH